jgi:hypothetical protein
MLIISFVSNGQICPGFQNGASSGGTSVSFFNGSGNLIATCNCQLTGNALKCGGCVPSSFTSYQYVNGGVLQTCANPIALPVELKEFNATVYNGDVQLSWSTETERDNLEFIVERSADAIEYIPFAKIPGAVNSTSPLNYSSMDSDPLKGISYYRLSQRDINGKITLLGIVSVELSGAVSGTLIAPNPSAGIIKIQLPLHNQQDMFDIMIADAMGKSVLSLQTSVDYELELTSGVYSVVVSRGTQIWCEKLIVLH